MKLSLVIPCYNEEEALPFFYEELMSVLSSMKVSFELIFVDDGSRDKTLSLLQAWAKENEALSYLAFSRNFGKEAAMYAGLCHAEGEYVAVMDADGQDPPALLPQMLSALESGDFDSVATRRVTRKGEPQVRSWFARAFYRLMDRISDTEIADGARDFRLMKREMVDAVVAMSEHNRFSKGIFGWIGFRTQWLPFENTRRLAGKTKWSFWRLFCYSINGMAAFSNVPLHAASFFGVGMTASALIAMLILGMCDLIGGISVAGWAWTAWIVVFVGGIQLLCLGVVGQYLAKIHEEAKGRPHYIIAKTNRKKADKMK
jgi:glycosyltransferase involved in cell wall biosynthesis